MQNGNAPRGRILIVDDEESARRSLGQILRDDGYDVLLASDSYEALQKVSQESPDILLADLRMPGMDGQELLTLVHEAHPDVAVILMTAHGTIRSAVQALRQGAEDYLTKPIEVEELEHLVERTLRKKKLLNETRLLRERLDEKYRFENIIGHSPEMMQLFGLVDQVAPSMASVLITGESGTGKELIAQAIHHRSPRRDAPFVKVACAALPETLLESELFGHERGAFTGAVARRPGRFEIAAGGTIFLDDIGDIPASMQVKLLRFLQERQFERVGGNQTLTVDARVITATRRDLAVLVSQGRFRDDLYDRLNVIQLTLPPLRDRPQDIPLLADHFVRRFANGNHREIAGLTGETLAAFMNYPWPGNVREMEHAIERAVVLAHGSQLEIGLFPAIRPVEAQRPPPDGPSIPGSTLADLEREAILKTLESVGGSTMKAAAVLGISPRTIQYKLKQYRSRIGSPREPRRVMARSLSE